MMKNSNQSEQLVFYPAYCTRCFEHLILKSLKNPCIICGKIDKIRHTIKKEDIMGTPENKNKNKKSKTAKQINTAFNKSLNLLQESLASLRVVVKYMQLDLEATRRENEALKDRLAKYEGESQSKD